ncbi:MAG: hypothetical protein AB7I19_06290 [Planctomycetota bacterium]
MFPDAFLPNFAIFLVAQVVAWAYLRTGLIPAGIAIIVGSLLFGDAALVARFGFGHLGGIYVGSLIAMQALTILAAGWFAIARWRRSRAAFRGRRDADYKSALIAYMKDEIAIAESLLRPIVRVDPWDLPTRVLLAKLAASRGDRAAARRQFRRARRLDGDQRFKDVIDEGLSSEVERESGDAPAAAAPDEPSTVASVS